MPRRIAPERFDRTAAPAIVSLLFLAAFAGLVSSSNARAETVFEGFILGRVAGTDSRPSWVTGGFGRFDVGADALDDEATRAIAKLHAALDWRPSDHFGVYVHAAARAEPSEHEGDVGGFIEAYLEGGGTLGRRTELRARAGLFLPPTSRENTDPAWSSPYAITHSAINSWIGEEVRLSGVLVDLYQEVTVRDELRFSAGLFGGNDAAGALLAWRGWSFGDRLTVFGEALALPPLDSLDTGIFRFQRDEGSEPIGSDLDDRLGWIALIRFTRLDRLTVQATYVDNGGDRRLHDIGTSGGEYAWATRWLQLGFDAHPGARWSFAGELIDGQTGMGDPNGPHAQLDFQAWYILASWHIERWRVTLRHDRFETVDRDASPPRLATINTEDGDAWTLAAFFLPTPTWRLGLQLLTVDADRPAAAESGFDPDTDGTSLIAEARWSF